MTVYTVQPGDTLAAISARFGLPEARIASINEIDPGRLIPGQALIIAYHRKIHTVRPGDTLYSVAAEYGISLRRLRQNNPILAGRDALYPGQVLVIEWEGRKKGAIETTGYAYPFIDRDILFRTLPYLTYLGIFSTGIRADGSLVEEDDGPLIGAALDYGTKPMLVLTSIGDDGTFSTDTVSRVLNSGEASARLMESVADMASRKGYAAVNADFEYIPAADREAYNRFIAGLSRMLDGAGITVDVSLPPKVSGDQPGLLYEAIDYPALGAAADTLLLMTYEWGYTYSEPRAVAPINEVRRVAEYAKSVIPASRLLLGIPNYGYSWRLPWRSGEAAETIGNTEALEIAIRRGVPIEFDTAAETPWFIEPRAPGDSREIWFEDARSIQAKLLLMAELNLRGIGVWQIMRWFPQLWALVNLQFDIV